jgi:Flp pilus assembly protein CpaB
MTSWDRLRSRRSSSEATLAEPAQRDGQAVSLRIRERSTDAAASNGRPPRAGALRQPLSFIGVALVLIAVIGYLAVYAQTTRRTDVLVAKRTLAAGTVVRSRDFRIGKIAADSATLAALVPASQLQTAVGRTLQTSIAGGSLLARTALGRTQATPASFTLTVPALHALGGGLQQGDHVTVLATYPQGSAGSAQAQAIARGLLVEAVGQPPTGIDAASATVAVTVALPDPSLATALALANSEAKIDLLRDGTRTSSAPIPAAREGSGP